MLILRILAMLLGLFYAVNAATMVLFPAYWFQTTPGVTATGGYNAHFVVDIGLIYLTSAACLALWALRPQIGSAVPKVAAVWPAMHAVFHLIKWGHHMPHGMAMWTELFGVVGAAVLGLVIASGAGERRA